MLPPLIMLIVYIVKRKGIINHNVPLCKVNMILIINLRLMIKISKILHPILVTLWVRLNNCRLHLTCKIVIIVILNKIKLTSNLPNKQLTYLVVVILQMIYVTLWYIMWNKPGKKVRNFLQNRNYLLSLWNYHCNSLVRSKLRLAKY